MADDLLTKLLGDDMLLSVGDENEEMIWLVLDMKHKMG